LKRPLKYSCHHAITTRIERSFTGDHGGKTTSIGLQ